MPVFSWMEGDLYVWEGAVQPSTPIAYVQDVYVSIAQNYENPRAVNGVYRKHLLDERVDATFTVPEASELNLISLLAARAPSVHMEIRGSAEFGLQGIFLYSGVLNALLRRGREGDVVSNGFRYFTNDTWSAYA